MKISALLVNYHTAPLLAGAVGSLLAQRDIDGLEIIVADNSESDEEYARLRGLLPPSVRTVQNTRNTGFAAACNAALALASGDAILLLNPDARLQPGALARLAGTLFASPRTGAVGPLTFWDDEARFALPPSTFPSLDDYLRRAVSRLHPRLGTRYAQAFRHKAIRLWTATAPVRVEALSGGHVLLKRTAIDKAGGLFDERFFMYWEDSDLMQRLHDAGYRLFIEPAARAVHHYDHHPGKDAMMSRGWPLYRAKHLQGHLRARLAEWLERHAVPGPDLPAELQPIPGEPIRLPVPDALQAGWVLEVSPALNFVPAMGSIGHGPHAEIPAECWQRFTGGRYFARLGSPGATPDLQRCWSWLN